jgi:hypothetical protein
VTEERPVDLKRLQAPDLAEIARGSKTERVAVAQELERRSAKYADDLWLKVMGERR